MVHMVLGSYNVELPEVVSSAADEHAHGESIQFTTNITAVSILKQFSVFMFFFIFNCQKINLLMETNILISLLFI